MECAGLWMNFFILKVDLKEPMFFLTAPRSGSAQLCKYLESDKENFIIPTVGEALIASYLISVMDIVNTHLSKYLE